MLKSLYEELGKAPAVVAKSTEPAVAATPASSVPTRDNPATAKFLARTRLNRAGSEKTTWHIDIDLAGSGIDYTVGDSFGIFPDKRSRAGRSGHQGARCAGGLPDRRAHAARGADRRRVALARARHAVPALFLPHRRRAAAEGEGARGRRRPGRRRRDARRARGDRKVSPASAPIRKPSSRRSIRCSRGSIRSRPRRRPIRAACRSPSTRCATGSASASASASPRPSSASASSRARR